jgi:hypothetical protein
MSSSRDRTQQKKRGRAEDYYEDGPELSDNEFNSFGKGQAKMVPRGQKNASLPATQSSKASSAVSDDERSGEDAERSSAPAPAPACAPASKSSSSSRAHKPNSGPSLGAANVKGPDAPKGRAAGAKAWQPEENYNVVQAVDDYDAWDKN